MKIAAWIVLGLALYTGLLWILGGWTS